MRLGDLLLGHWGLRKAQHQQYPQVLTITPRNKAQSLGPPQTCLNLLPNPSTQFLLTGSVIPPGLLQPENGLSPPPPCPLTVTSCWPRPFPPSVIFLQEKELEFESTSLTNKINIFLFIHHFLYKYWSSPLILIITYFTEAEVNRVTEQLLLLLLLY